jgi:hypothetical protein
MEASIIENSKRISETNEILWRRNLAEAQIQLQYNKLENRFLGKRGLSNWISMVQLSILSR